MHRNSILIKIQLDATVCSLIYFTAKSLYMFRVSTAPIIRSRARSKRDGTCAETRFGLSAKRTSPFKSAGVSVQSTAGSQGVWISGQQLYRPCSVVQFEAAGYPLHSHLSPSLPLPCVTVCHQIPNALYQLTFKETQSLTRNKELPAVVVTPAPAT